MGKVRHGRVWSGSGAAQDVGEPVAHPMPWQHFGWLWQSRMLQEPKNKRSCWPGLCKSVSPARPAREFGGFGGKPGGARQDPGTGPRKCQDPKGWGLSPPLCPLCAMGRGSM